MRSYALLALCGALFLVACSGGDNQQNVLAGKSCPQVAVVRDLATMSDYGREEAQPANLVAKAELGRIDGTCSFADDSIDVRFTVSMRAERGARLGGDRVSVPFFIAVVSADGKVISKEVMSADFEFIKDKPMAVRIEKLRVSVPAASPQAQDVQPRVLLGWQH